MRKKKALSRSKSGVSQEVTIEDIWSAKKTLSQYITSTPLLYNGWLSHALGCELYLKMENMQPVGSFKIRGASYKIAQLNKEQMKRGVIAASAGNHAQGVAWGAKQMGTDAWIVMPKTASLLKIKNTQALGAKVILEGENYDEANEACKRIARESKRTIIPAFEDKDVIAGQGTVGLEILEQLPEVDVVIGSVGGGGLMAGVATALKSHNRKIKVYGSQAAGSAAMRDAFKKKKPLQIASANTFADGIAVRTARPLLYDILKNTLEEILVADDEMIAEALLVLMERAKVVTEGAAAVSYAVLPQIAKQIKGKKVALIVCGGNIDVNLVGKIIDRGLCKLGRRLRMTVRIPDVPGSLAALTALIAQNGASIVQAIHDRADPSAPLNSTEVNLTLETQGSEHAQQIIAALKKSVEFIRVH